MPLTVEESIKIAQQKMKVFDDLWNEVNDPSGYVATMAREKEFTSLLRGEVYAKGAAVLRDLSKNHFSREKPGFFARLFRTQAAREYKAERDEMNRISKQLKDLSEKNEMLAVTVEGDQKSGMGTYTYTHDPVSVEYMTKDRESFAFSDHELDENMKATRNVFLQKLNANEPNMQDAKDQIICNFLREIDSKMTGSAEEKTVQPEPVKAEDPHQAEFIEELNKDVSLEPAQKNTEEPITDNTPTLSNDEKNKYQSLQ
ncbi:MAG: hypothetical protein MJ082_02760 [Clostridia bacterium]|nr:hypothetical protein [Clostridia bacterium]